jgi:hypothetical protein
LLAWPWTSVHRRGVEEVVGDADVEQRIERAIEVHAGTLDLVAETASEFLGIDVRTPDERKKTASGAMEHRSSFATKTSIGARASAPDRP